MTKNGDKIGDNFSSKNLSLKVLNIIVVTLMLVTDVGDQCVGDMFEMLVTDLIHWKYHQHNEKSRQHNDSATNISNQSPS